MLIILTASYCDLDYGDRGRAGITFNIELVIPLDAPEAVVDLDLDGVVTLHTVPDVIGLTGRRPGAAVLRHMVWLQQDLDTMRAEAKKHFRTTRPGDCSYCGKWIKCDIYRHVATGVFRNSALCI